MLGVCITAPKLGSDEKLIPGFDKRKGESFRYCFTQSLFSLIHSSCIKVPITQFDCMKN